MKRRGLTRVATAIAMALLFAGVQGAPARAEGKLDPQIFTLNPGKPGVFAKDFNPKGCAGIAGGVAKPGTDGWLFVKPAGDFANQLYVFIFVVRPGERVALLVDATGVHAIDRTATDWLDWLDADDATAGDLSKAPANAEAERGTPAGLPTEAAPSGVAGALTGDGAWVQTPAGWRLRNGKFLGNLPAEVSPVMRANGQAKTFNLLRVCLPAAASASPPASAPSASASASVPAGAGGQGGGLPVTGTNLWVLGGTGLALVAAGGGLFLLRRRRESVKFVA